MLRSIVLLRPRARFAIFLSLALASVSCSDSGDDDETGLGGSGTGAAAGSGATGGSSGTGNGTAGTSSNGGSSGADNSTANGPDAVGLGDAADYVILAKSGIANVPGSDITGDLGLSPAAASFVTGFAPTKAGILWTSAEVTGNIYAADNDAPTPTNLTAAVSDMLAAYEDAATRPLPDFENLGDGAIGGLTLAPGLYKWSSTVTIPSEVKLSGAAGAVWIFQIDGDLSMSAAQRVTLLGGARARNIFWQVAGAVNIGSTAHVEGIVLGKTEINLGASSSINGRLLAQTAVSLASSNVTEPAQ